MWRSLSIFKYLSAWQKRKTSLNRCSPRALFFFHRSKLTSIYLLPLTEFKILMNVEEKVENQYWACQSLTIFQLRMSEFRSTLMPVECSINSVKIPLSSSFCSWVVITRQLSEKNQGRKAGSIALSNWLVRTIICFINLFSLLSCQYVLEESILSAYICPDVMGSCSPRVARLTMEVIGNPHN